MKTLITLMAASIASFAQAAPLSLLEEEGCIEVFEEISANYLDETLEAYANYHNFSFDRQEAFKLVSVRDLRPGSFNLTRLVRLENSSMQIDLISHGNLYCQNEKILTIADVIVK